TRRAEWTELAAEVDLYRATYHVPATEPAAIPVDHRDHPVAADLAARVTAAHKYSAQTTKDPLTGEEVQGAYVRQVGLIESRETPSEAEQVIDRLAAERGPGTSATARERIAERLRAVRDAGGSTGPEGEQGDDATSVARALSEIRRRRREEQEQRPEPEGNAPTRENDRGHRR
ncbi:hypothetical protein, partial [Tersicoccus sp. Bi-70]|uniref:hypothetical protein n=1 Tax=Tersicoccus sp. Bi-70 TaxID=1897634 RepID=UPI001301780B